MRAAGGVGGGEGGMIIYTLLAYRLLFERDSVALVSSCNKKQKLPPHIWKSVMLTIIPWNIIYSPHISDQQQQKPVPTWTCTDAPSSPVTCSKPKKYIIKEGIDFSNTKLLGIQKVRDLLRA